jgi:hypothetical protein
MSNESWQVETTRFLGMSEERRRLWLAGLLYELSTMARDTYTVGGDGLDDPKRMRRFNELIRRAANQLQNKSKNYSTMPDEIFLELVGAEIEALGFSTDKLGGRLQACLDAPVSGSS